jgi:hypothetical protein
MADIGAMLREARMREHRDIAEFEERTKIRAKYLRALEDEEWSLLPGYTFAKAFLRTYADMLGLDGRMLVDEFKRQYRDPSEAELAPVQSGREGRGSRDRGGDHGSQRERGRRERQSGPSGRVLAVAVLVVLLAGALFVVHELRKKNPTNSASSSSSSTTSTTSSSSKRRHTTAPHRVALQLVASTPVRVCLVGYRSSHGGALRRVNGVLDPGTHGPVYHADNHFLVSFSGGSARMIIDGRSVSVPASAVAISYEVFRSGHYSELVAGSGPHCP